MSLSLGTRSRVQARIALSHALTVLPIRLIITVRDRHAAASGRTRPVWGTAAKILRHRPLSPLTDFQLPDNRDIRLTAVRSRLAQLLFWYGENGYEGAETRWWRTLCGQAVNILEVGANIGYYTVQGAHSAPNAAYTTVEANPEAAGIVSRNVELNQLNNVKVIQAAVVGDDAPATMELALPDQEQYAAPTGAYLATGTEGIHNRPAGTSVTVPTVPMSQLVGGVDLLKLDIEGYEANVLESVQPWLQSQRPTIVVEVLKEAPRLRAIIRELRADGYEVRAIGERDLHVITDDELNADAPLPPTAHATSSSSPPKNSTPSNPAPRLRAPPDDRRLHTSTPTPPRTATTAITTPPNETSEPPPRVLSAASRDASWGCELNEGDGETDEGGEAEAPFPAFPLLRSAGLLTDSEGRVVPTTWKGTSPVNVSPSRDATL
ncbi:FkbM family methyltransferase [Actinomadura miaoliensis]|uniref:Methyltransferase FkbM domain-containing protein n=1 Tax=Actinomadura miaoliensis TaxID=430685 RepID=A0ABP7UV15_9ACTN